MNSSTTKEKTEMRKVETLKLGPAGAPEWWSAVPEGERTLLMAIARMLRGARRSRRPDVARAAAKWERRLGCFIRVRLMNAKLRKG